MNIPMRSTDRSFRDSRHKDADALDLYLGRIQQNLAALNEQCVQLGIALSKSQEWLGDIHKLQQYLEAESPTIAELRRTAEEAPSIVASGRAGG